MSDALRRARALLSSHEHEDTKVCVRAEDLREIVGMAEPVLCGKTRFDHAAHMLEFRAILAVCFVVVTTAFGVYALSKGLGL